MTEELELAPFAARDENDTTPEERTVVLPKFIWEKLDSQADFLDLSWHQWVTRKLRDQAAFSLLKWTTIDPTTGKVVEEGDTIRGTRKVEEA